MITKNRIAIRIRNSVTRRSDEQANKYEIRGFPLLFIFSVISSMTIFRILLAHPASALALDESIFGCFRWFGYFRWWWW